MDRKIVLGLHIAAGMLALAVAPLAMLTAKGGRAHRRWGQIYFWAMMAAAATAAALVLWFGSSIFLLMVAVFSAYLALSGYRVLKRKQPARDRAGALDWIAAATAIAGSGGLIAWGATLLQRGARSGFPTVALVFGGLGLLTAGGDVVRFVRPPADKRAWWYRHLTNMVAAYIATVTAFSAVNFRFVPMPWRWLWPTVFGTCAIFAWRRHYRRKFEGA